MRHHMNSFPRDAHLDVFEPLLLIESHPGPDVLEQTQMPDATKNQAHESRNQAAVPPAGGLEGRPEVSVQAPLTRLAVIQKKAVGATQAEVVKEMDHRNTGGKSRGVNRRGEAGKAVLNHPKVEFSGGLKAEEILCNLLIMPSPHGKRRVSGSRRQQLLAGAEIILNGMPGS